MKIAWFTDSRMMADEIGVFPLRDQWPHFISPLARHCRKMTIASPCGHMKVTSGPQGLRREYLPLTDSLGFQSLPYYEKSEDFYLRAPKLLAAAVKPIRKVIANHDIIAIRYHNMLGPLTEWLARRAGKPVVAYWAGPPILQQARRNYPENSWRHKLARAVAWIEQSVYATGLARRAALNCFIDQEEYELMGAPEEERSHWVVPLLVQSEDIIPPQPRRETEFRVVFAGRLTRHKGVFDLLEAVASLVPAFPELRLSYLGDGPVRETLEAEVRQRHLEGVVNLAGQIDRGRLFEMLAQSHLLILPSWSEGLPKIIWEAWAAGLPVIATPVGSVARHVLPDYNGLLVSPGDSGGLAKAIASLMTNEGQRFRLACGGNETVRKYSWESQIADLAEALKRVWYNRK